jgi:hypothetical protein
MEDNSIETQGGVQCDAAKKAHDFSQASHGAGTFSSSLVSLRPSYNAKNTLHHASLCTPRPRNDADARRVGAWVRGQSKKENKMKKLMIIALALSMAGPALAQSNTGGSGTTGSTATGLTATGSGSGMHNGGSGMNGNGMNSTGMNNNDGTGMKNGKGMKGSSRMNGNGSTSQD